MEKKSALIELNMLSYYIDMLPVGPRYHDLAKTQVPVVRELILEKDSILQAVSFLFEELIEEYENLDKGQIDMAEVKKLHKLIDKNLNAFMEQSDAWKKS